MAVLFFIGQIEVLSSDTPSSYPLGRLIHCTKQCIGPFFEKLQRIHSIPEKRIPTSSAPRPAVLEPLLPPRTSALVMISADGFSYPTILPVSNHRCTPIALWIVYENAFRICVHELHHSSNQFTKNAPLVVHVSDKILNKAKNNRIDLVYPPPTQHRSYNL